jgi:hypothetical protein
MSPDPPSRSAVHRGLGLVPVQHLQDRAGRRAVVRPVREDRAPEDAPAGHDPL